MTEPDTVVIEHAAYSLRVVDEPPGYEDSIHGPSKPYDREYSLGESNYRAGARHGVTLQGPGSSHSALVSATGGTTGVHAWSALALDNLVLLAVCGWVVALRVPDLELVWSLEIDHATCFGVHVADVDGEPACLSHGELEIARFDLSGRKLWSVGGADIFSEGFRIVGQNVVATDFNGWQYWIQIKSGEISATLASDGSPIGSPGRP